MKRFCALLTVATLLAFVSDSAKSVRADEVEKEIDAVLLANNNFYSALNALFTGDLGPMFEAWSHKSDVSYMGPAGGRQLGWDEVAKNWQLQAERKLGGQVMPAGTQVSVHGNIAIITTMEIGENTLGGTPEKVEIRATNIFRKEDGKWKMIAHHTDLLPFLEK